MSLALTISPHGHLLVEAAEGMALPAATVTRITQAFQQGAAAGILHLATVELGTSLSPSLSYAREIARDYLTRLCHLPGISESAELPPLEPPGREEFTLLSMRAPPMRGLEYLTADLLAEWWQQLDSLVREQIRAQGAGAGAWLRARNPLWRLVGRVTFHLAENKRDPERPFAFLATYAHRLSAQATVQHLPLSRALQEYAHDRQALITLLTPIQRATEHSALAKELVESRQVYQPLAWSPRQAYRFLQDIPQFELSGLLVRVPNWWKPQSPPRPRVTVTVGEQAVAHLGAASLLDFRMDVSLGGMKLTAAELEAALSSGGGLVQLRGQWVEIDRAKLAAALEHWKTVEAAARHGGISFHEGMRLLAGASLGSDVTAQALAATREWTGIQPGAWLEQTLARWRDPEQRGAPPAALRATLRPYQQAGLQWLDCMTRLGLGACLADDMGLGKTIQTIATLLRRRDEGVAGPSLLVAPASLLANWKAELQRFAPTLRYFVAHPSETEADLKTQPPLEGCDLVITTYSMVTRLEWLAEVRWQMVILDEAQAIKNTGTRQSRAVKALPASARVALTGTPVENRLGDLWSLFDFLNPGLLGSSKEFSAYAKQLATAGENAYAPLRKLVQPYILRRLKTDKTIIADLPEKSEVKAYCTLSKQQAALYQQSVEELRQALQSADGMQRRGIVLAYLLRFKQICNHPAQWSGTGHYEPAASGKFARLGDVCSELAERQERVLVFTQFREITEPLREFLGGVFGRPGLVLHGATPVARRRELVEAFQQDEGPPFFVLSIKAGGTGLNLTAASQVIHFDRWWNPAVENQATDRAFRIGQKKNVLVHKFVCRGTVEERIDELIADKVSLAENLLGGAERLLTEMNNQELLSFVSLDIHRAVES